MNSKIIIFAFIIFGLAAFAVIISFVGEGGVRHVDIYLPEQIKDTISFQKIDGETKIVGIVGIDGEPNPTLVMRAGDFEYVLTVQNLDDVPHQLYIDGLDVQTQLLQPGDEETLIMLSDEETNYSYFDIANEKIRLGELKSVFVVAKDKFEGG